MLEDIEPIECPNCGRTHYYTDMCLCAYCGWEEWMEIDGKDHPAFENEEE